MRRLLLWVMQSRLYTWLLLNVVPYIRFTTYYPTLRGHQYAKGYAQLLPGHIIVAVDRRKLTTKLIPGLMSHAALCVSKRTPHYWRFEVAEMTHHGYTRSDFFDICKEADRVVVLQCKDWDDAYVAALVDACLSLAWAPYDTSFELGVKALYCSELVYQSDLLAAAKLGVEPRLKVDLTDLAAIGRKYISPDGLLYAANVWCVWDSDGEFDKLTGLEICARQTGVRQV